MNADGRAGILVGDSVFDVEAVSGGRLPPDPQRLVGAFWDEVLVLAERGASSGGVDVQSVRLGPPVPVPPMIMAVVANFPPAERMPLPMVVGKSPSAVVGPYDDIVLPDPARLPLGQAFVIPEPELGVVVRGGGRDLGAEEAMSAIAGFVVAQDVTERRHELGASPPPWTWTNLPAKTLGKSIDTFCPIGPALVTPDELDDPARLVERCWVNGRLVFETSTADLLWSPAELVALLSAFMTLPAGLVCLCGCDGTVDGSPIPFLAGGDEVRTEIEGIGNMVNTCVAASRSSTGGR